MAPMEAKYFGNDELSIGKFQYLLKGLSHSQICRHSSLKEDGFDEVLSLSHIALEISCHGIAEARDDVIIRRGNLLKVDHIRLGKDAAPPRDPGRRLRFQGELAELFDGEAEAACLLIEKGARACGAEGIHRKVADLETAVLLFEEDQFGVFASDVNDRPNLWIEMLGGLRLGNDLIDEIPGQKLGERFPSDAGKRDGFESVCRESVEGSLPGPSERFEKAAPSCGCSVLPALRCGHRG